MSDRTGDGHDEPTGRITVNQEAGGHVLHLSGDIDAPVVEKLSTDHSLDGLRIIAVDVGELDYIDSTGLTFLVRWAKAAQKDGRPAEIRRTTHRFDRVLEVTGLTSLFAGN